MSVDYKNVCGEFSLVGEHGEHVLYTGALTLKIDSRIGGLGCPLYVRAAAQNKYEC